MKLRNLLFQLNHLDPEIEVCIDSTYGARKDLILDQVYVNPEDKKGYVTLDYTKKYNSEQKEQIILIRFSSNEELVNFDADKE